MTIPDSGTPGIHHVTAIARDARANLAFYTEVLGLRLVKKSVNQDDPGTYHLFFADGRGHPGTSLTFFPFANAAGGREGVGQAIRVAFRVPCESLGWWEERLRGSEAAVGSREERFGENLLSLSDPDGLSLELVEVDDPDPSLQWRGSGIPLEAAIAGFHSVTLLEATPDPVARVLKEVLEMSPAEVEGRRRRYRADPDAPGSAVDVVHASDGGVGRVAAGSVHHVAFRARTREELEGLRSRVASAGLRPTPVIDRHWFESVYFREPGGVLFELATDGPGFTVDEAEGALGSHLVLPPWLEDRRAEIEAGLPPLDGRGGAGGDEATGGA